MDWYGTIWVHRGRPDRRALDFAVQALRQGRHLVIAPEGRYTLSHGLERGTSGAAYVAMRARLPVVPVALTGTENPKVYSSLRRLRRPCISLTVGAPIHLRTDAGVTPRALKDATEEIMHALARLLPPEYRGVYGGTPAAPRP
jgi:1-acyl-sn-glycerol-3-phosphate acyltransferase